MQSIIYFSLSDHWRASIDDDWPQASRAICAFSPSPQNTRRRRHLVRQNAIMKRLAPATTAQRAMRFRRWPIAHIYFLDTAFASASRGHAATSEYRFLPLPSRPSEISMEGPLKFMMRAHTTPARIALGGRVDAHTDTACFHAQMRIGLDTCRVCANIFREDALLPPPLIGIDIIESPILKKSAQHDGLEIYMRRHHDARHIRQRGARGRARREYY